MQPITLALVAALAACGPKAATKKPEGGAPILAKKIALSWGISQAAASADVFLQTTDETGAQVSHALGTFPGQCAVITPGVAMTALTGVACWDTGNGIELHAVAQQGQVVVLRLHTQQGMPSDPMSRDEVMRFPAPPGAAIAAHP